ncbi:glycosylation-dependent cell adhesion molecule 1-like [Saimiri boliviensis]|uniref:glycosylation-dependent cell adhesion molecule 1-like n=1 Tax=Saimiri boliviensis TaxID=27679 RepID=UPI00193E0C19|nr:glycosylation-dependent cell adhesion molecule 1-like [Saimiri boliviensis boliviensis]
MKFFTVLLLASLASTSLAVLGEPEDEIHSETQPADASAQVTPSHPKKDHVSNEDLSKEAVISKEDLVSKEKAVKRAKSQKPIPQEDNFENVQLQLEETAEVTPRAATTSERKLTKLGHKIGKNLDKATKGIMNYLKNLIPSANDVMRP